MSFKSDATYYFHITKPCKITNSGANSVSLTDIDSLQRSVAGRKVSELVKRYAMVPDEKKRTKQRLTTPTVTVKKRTTDDV